MHPGIQSLSRRDYADMRANTLGINWGTADSFDESVVVLLVTRGIRFRRIPLRYGHQSSRDAAREWPQLPAICPPVGWAVLVDRVSGRLFAANPTHLGRRVQSSHWGRGKRGRQFD